MKFKFCLTKKRKIVNIYVFEEDGMEKRYESDMTRKEKRQNELKKLKSMTFKQKPHISGNIIRVCLRGSSLPV